MIRLYRGRERSQSTQLLPACVGTRARARAVRCPPPDPPSLPPAQPRRLLLLLLLLLLLAPCGGVRPTRPTRRHAFGLSGTAAAAAGHGRRWCAVRSRRTEPAGVTLTAATAATTVTATTAAAAAAAPRPRGHVASLVVPRLSSVTPMLTLLFLLLLLAPAVFRVLRIRVKHLLRFRFRPILPLLPLPTLWDDHRAPSSSGGGGRLLPQTALPGGGGSEHPTVRGLEARGGGGGGGGRVQDAAQRPEQVVPAQVEFESKV